MALKAKKPVATDDKLKMFVYGDSGVGKTTAAIQFPKAYLIDMEKGSKRYWESLQNMGSVSMQTTSFDEVCEQIKDLMTTKHEYRTLIIDPITIANQDLQDKWMRLFERHAKSEKERELKDFGPRYWGKVKGENRRFRRLLTDLDMNIICTAHQKDIWSDSAPTGAVTFDSDKKDRYFFDFVFRLEQRGDKRFAITEKKRESMGKQIFPPEFEWSYENFANFYGKDLIEKPSVPIQLASDVQLAEIERLLAVVKIPDEEVEKWLEKDEVDNFSELTSERITKYITHLKGKLDIVKGDINGGKK